MTRVSSGPFRNSDPWLASKILRGDFGTYKLSWYPPFLCRFYTPDNSTAPPTRVHNFLCLTISHIVVLGFIPRRAHTMLNSPALHTDVNQPQGVVSEKISYILCPRDTKKAFGTRRWFSASSSADIFEIRGSKGGM